MPCYKPLEGYRSRTPNPSGKYSITFNPNHGYTDMKMTIPCGQCIGCRLEKSRQWAMRCMYQTTHSDHNQFITLTYNDENLPIDGNLDLRDFQLFMKRLRKQFGKNIKYYHCGEYGEDFSRPHYHALLFNLELPDKILYSEQNGDKLYISETIEKIWGKGFAPIGEVTFDSAAYVARYCTKKITGKMAEDHYEKTNIITGELQAVVPEYATMSNGIGKEWFNEFKDDVFPSDYLIINGKKVKPPKYFDNLLEKETPLELARIKNHRKQKSKLFMENNTPERLAVREQLQQIRAKQLKRNIE